MRRVAAISAGPRSARPRGRRAFSLLDFSDFSAIGPPAMTIGAVVAATPLGGKQALQGAARPLPHHARRRTVRPAEARYITSARYLDDEGVASAGPGVVSRERGSQPDRLDTHDRIGLRV